MRKVFWCSLAGGIMVLGGVFTTAFFAARHPQSLAGKLVLSAGRVATSANPVTLLNQAIVRLENPATGPVAGAAPVAGGEEVAEPAELHEGGWIVANGDPIVIQEPAEPVAQTLDMDAIDRLIRVANDDAVECPAGGATECPLSMPLCDEEPCEKLGMPCSEGDAEEQEEGGVGSTGAVEKLFRLFEKSVKKSDEGTIEPAAPKSECREDPHHSYHYSGCPYTGRGSMHCPSGCTLPAAQPAPLTQPGAEEASEPGKPEQHSSALRSIRRFGTRGVETPAPAAAELDTMEYRTSDGQLYDLGRGSL